MFKCQNCGNVVPPKTKCRKIILQSRTKEYPYRSKCNKGYVNKGKFFKERDHADDHGGSGKEIAKEIMVCPECATKLVGD
jgi:DNA-directed RNA polymerase subunit M/transcription elongation factor TFIIS